MGSDKQGQCRFCYVCIFKNDYAKTICYLIKLLLEPKWMVRSFEDAMPSLCVFFSVKGLRYVKKDVIAAVNIKEG